jgi:hypothetical protein
MGSTIVAFTIAKTLYAIRHSAAPNQTLDRISSLPKANAENSISYPTDYRFT